MKINDYIKKLVLVISVCFAMLITGDICVHAEDNSLGHFEITEQDESRIVITRSINRVIDSFYAAVVTQSGSRVGFINIRASGTVTCNSLGNITGHSITVSASPSGYIVTKSITYSGVYLTINYYLSAINGSTSPSSYSGSVTINVNHLDG